MQMLDQLHKDLEDLLLALASVKKADDRQRAEMFRIYNSLFAVKERNTTCGACVSRVYNALRNYYNANVANVSVTEITEDKTLKETVAEVLESKGTSKKKKVKSNEEGK